VVRKGKIRGNKHRPNELYSHITSKNNSDWYDEGVGAEEETGAYQSYFTQTQYFRTNSLLQINVLLRWYDNYEFVQQSKS
jgi:hypothetical protein